MKTITIQIGNSDDHLPQKRWSQFQKCVDDSVQAIVSTSGGEVHFCGTSMPDAPWQNAAWVFNISELGASRLKVEMSELARRFNQVSIAWTVGVTTFI